MPLSAARPTFAVSLAFRPALIRIPRTLFRLACLPVLLLAGCATTRTYVAPALHGEVAATPPADSLAYRVLLLGNTGLGAGVRPSMQALVLAQAGVAAPVAAVLLGDAAGPRGLPEGEGPGRDAAEARLRALVEPLAARADAVVVLPGDRDWNGGAPDGAEAVRRQEAWVEALGERVRWLPNDAFPGPVEVELTERLRLLVLDTAWWLYPHARPTGDAGDYDLDEKGDVALALANRVADLDDETLIVLGHHPLVTNGARAGHFPLRTHLFPLTELVPGAYVPLPGVGSLYPLYVRFLGRRQDLAHPGYRTLRRAFEAALTPHERLVYVAAHDQNLQYFPTPERAYVVSGSAAGGAPVARGRGAAFTSGVPGFAVLDLYRDGALWLSFWTDEEGGRRLLHTRVLPPEPGPVPPAVAEQAVPSFADSLVTLAAGPAYARGKTYTFFFGAHNRAAWATPVTVPVLDLGTERGGLTIVKQGGGMQTRSLRLRGADGYEYVLRSIDKDPSKSVPPALQGTVATDLIQDQIASLHPYAAFLIPALAEAAGVPHTHPKLVYVPDDPRLGRYRDAFAGQLMMLELRPDDDMSAHPEFEGSEEVVGAGKLYEELAEDADHRVDQYAFARARLFDMLLSDWDRHRDQWRWIEYDDPDGKGKLYRPFPRDRDFALNRLDGLLTGQAGRFDIKFQDFTESYGLIRGLTKNGFEQDRRFTNALAREAWLAIADSLVAALSDSVIEAALQQWPEAIRRLDGAETARLLKIRRDKLPKVARKYYRLLARAVDVVGSDEDERFDVRRLDAARTEVVVSKLDDGVPERELYRRVFLTDETDEVRLFGLDGDDVFVVEGAVRRGPLVRIVGGPGRDAFEDRSRVAQAGHQTVIYDTERGKTWSTGPEARLVRSEDPAVNRYDPLTSYRHDTSAPKIAFGRNDDDGLFVGGGYAWTDFRFRKMPYAAHQEVVATAARTGAFTARYSGHFVDVVGGWDVVAGAEVQAPGSFRNFYGLGNETPSDAGDAAYYRARLRQGRLALGLARHAAEGATVQVGPVVSYTAVRRDPERFVAQPQAGLSARAFDAHWYAGARASLLLTSLDHPVNPAQGGTWATHLDVNAALAAPAEPYARLASDVRVFLSPRLAPQLTLAARVGGAHRWGAYPFFEAATLGGRDNLRGYRGTRFAGRTSLYQNLELRAELLRFSTYLAIGKLGVLGFVDNGRVWTDGEASRVWHQGYGGGLWTELFGAFVVSGTYAASAEHRAFVLQLGFQY